MAAGTPTTISSDRQSDAASLNRDRCDEAPRDLTRLLARQAVGELIAFNKEGSPPTDPEVENDHADN